MLFRLLQIVPCPGMGFLFIQELSRIHRGLSSVSWAIGWLVAVALVVYLAIRVRVMWKDRIYHGVPSVNVQQLRQRIEQNGDQILLADVRSHGYYDPEAKRIKNSIRLEPASITERIDALPRDKEIYLYCT